MFISETWTPKLEDPTTDEFKDLATVYVSAFKETFSQVENNAIGNSTTISIAEVRVVSFILNDYTIPDNSFSRQVMAQERNCSFEILVAEK